MRVSMASIDFLPNIGGVTQHIVEIARAMLAGGDTVEVIAPAHSERWGDLKKGPFAEVAGGLAVWRIPYVVNRSVRFLTGQISSRVSERRLKRFLIDRLHDWKPDVVHWHALEARHHPMMGWTDSARVWTNHTSNFIVGLNSSRREQYRLEAQQADEIICPSEELRELTLSLGIARERVHFIPNGVDCARFRSDVDTTQWRERLRLNGHERMVLCPRRLERKNGVSYFVRAAIDLLHTGTKDVRFVLAGNFHGPRADSEEALVEEMIAASGFADRFHALGRVENGDMPGLYACSDLVVMPSLMEATSLSAMEAMAARKALVSTDVGGLPFLVRAGENGLLVPPRDPASLARAMRELLEAPAKAAEFGANGRARVERELDWTAIARSTREIYRSAMQRFEERRRLPAR
jgi:glycosyltransferase involved in cell wall biosynthesis